MRPLSSMRFAVSLPLAAAAVAWAPGARADEVLPAVAFTAPPECPDVHAFEKRLGERLAEVPNEVVRRSVRGVVVKVTATAAGYTGTLVLRDADGAASSREVSAATCGEIVEAFAVLSALNAGILASGPPRPPPPPPPAPPAAPPPRATPAEPATDATRAARETRVTVGAGFAAATFTGPTLGWGPEPFVEVASFGGGVLSPAVRLSGTWIGGETATSSPAGSAALTLLTLRLDGCPVRLSLASSLSLLPCAGLRVGEIRGSGAGVSAPRQESVVWLSAEVLARLQWEPLRWLVLEAQGGVVAPFFRYAFSFAPDVALYETPALGATFGAGAGLRFP